MTNTDYFVALTECHMISDISELMYYPGMKRWWQSVDPVVRVWTGKSLRETATTHTTGEELVKWMDQGGVDVAFALREPMMDVTGGVAPMSTNGFILKQIAPYPERLFFECNVGPILRRGIEHAMWELEYLVKERDARLCKVYQPEDTAPLNDRAMYPFYEKAQELGVPLTVHTGMSYVVPQPSKYTLPILLDDICLDFPDLKIIAYHAGWPYCEELFGLAGKHRNLYVSFSGIIGWMARAPYKGYHLVGQALEWVGPNKIVLGLDMPFSEIPRIVNWVRNLEMPEELQEKWGYPEITDEIRAKMLGLNLAKLTNIEPTKRVPAATTN